MTENAGVRPAAESVALLFVALGAGIVATLVLLQQTNDPESLMFVYFVGTVPVGVSIVASIVGGALVGLRVDDTTDAMLGAAVGCAIGFAVVLFGTYLSYQLLEIGTVDSAVDVLQEEWQLFSAHGAGVVVMGALAALAPSRLE